MKFGKFNSKDNKYNKLKELKSEGRVDEKEIGELSRGQKIVNYITLILSIIGVIITIYFSIVGYRMGLFTDQEKLKAFLDSLGKGAPWVFILIQIIQTVIPIIPGALTCPAGALVFGNGFGFILNFIGIMIGSVIDFFLARKYGRGLVRALVSKKTYAKYIGYLDKKDTFKKVFTFGMFFPVSPADFLCMLAGLSNMSFKDFFIILSLGKPITLFIYTYGITELFKFFAKIFL
ncbi:TVP38/TMEM64 family protein [Citroniella saccharovorans]|uniref:TVP38/TMEM64 family membrane protein n=1 Tax=Citroniella saccharovorans TaxID=2053367 RepID=A0AAW9MU86_9FIRM|nr:TVP38/TMEM64 family protein [Citroniella saccharovorans]MEB3428503.1 TVP38/TMEM64 family protein [Citroniella saccharovorans]